MEILTFLARGIGVPFLCLVMGRFFSSYFPFRLTRKFYIPIKNIYLQKFLISDETHAWGRTPPEQLPEKYFRVSSGDRGKMCIWGVLFYLELCLLFILGVLMKCGNLTDSLQHFQFILFLGLILLYPLESLDFIIGAQQSMNAKNLYHKRLTGLLVANIFHTFLMLLLCAGLYRAFRLK